MAKLHCLLTGIQNRWKNTKNRRRSMMVDEVAIKADAFIVSMLFERLLLDLCMMWPYWQWNLMLNCSKEQAHTKTKFKAH